MSTARLLAFTVIATFALGAWYTYSNYFPATNLGAGVPLTSSSTEINVLEEAEPMPFTTSSTTQVQVVAPTPIPPATFNETTAKLGTTLSLLVNSWSRGGPQTRSLAAAASELADQTGQPAVAEAAAALRTATPREGPITQSLLLIEVAHALTLGAPSDLPEDDTAAEAQKSWLRKQIENLVTIQATPSTQNRWSMALLTAQQQIARGIIEDAQITLTSSPLSADSRLDELRGLTKGYISQTGKLYNLVDAYTQTFLTNRVE